MNARIIFNLQSLLAVIFSPLILFSVCHFELTQTKHVKDVSDYELTPSFFKFVSSGFSTAAADALWIQTLQQIGMSNYSPETLPGLLNFYRLATSLDPNFYELYDQAGVLFAFYYQAPDAAIEILNKGIFVYENGHPPKDFWTHPYSLYLYKAYANGFLKNDWAAAKVDYLKLADVPGSPNYFQKMRFWLKEEGSEKILAAKILKLLISTTTDPQIKARYQEKLKQYE